MTTFEVRQEVDRFILHFDTPRREINAYAFASALVGLSDAIREANAAVNPGYRVEVVVEALSDGSFRATIRTVFQKAKNRFSHEAVKAIVYGIIATHIYEKAIKTEEPPHITVTEDLVTIEVGKNKIIVPRNVYEAKRQLENSERFKSAIGRVFEAAATDPTVKGVAMSAPGDKLPEPFYIPREKFALFQSTVTIDETTREIIETAQLEISRAILERGKRKWEFFWRGIKIAAPIMDEQFFDKFFAHEVTIAPGDALEVALRIVQEKSPDTGIFVNIRYEVVEVYSHVPRVKQTGF